MALLLIKLLVIFCPKPYFVQPISYKVHLVEFNNILHAASIPRGDVHTLEVLQLHVILQSYGPFTY